MSVFNRLMEKSQYWKNMNRSSAEQIKASEDYYKNELMPDIIEYFLENNKFEGICENLILTLGKSYEPLVLSILITKPKRVRIIHTDESKHLLDNVIEITGLKPSQYSTALVDAVDSIKLYRTIKETYEEWGRPENIYVDFTGGTKAMSGACAMAAALINANLIYIGGKQLEHLKKPDPGTEKFYEIDNPYNVFGDWDREQAISLFNNMDYVSAGRIFEELDRKVDTKEYLSLKCLALAYSAWDSLDINSAVSNLTRCLDVVECGDKSKRKYILLDHKEKLIKQLEFVRVLEKIFCSSSSKRKKEMIFESIGHIIANLYQNAMRREKQEKYELAALLLYRILEAIEQKRLWNYGIDTSNADFSKTGMSEPDLLQKVNTIHEKIKFRRINTLELKIGLMDGYILLAALEDDIITKKPGKEKDKLCELSDKVNARNKSIFAHGFEFIDKVNYNKFKKMVEEYMNLLFDVEGINSNELFSVCEFIKL
ncbi:MAG: TIGR02710 family CRISPR-associated protein [Clostridiaceae bacterium]|nr:TIGR02710 family CRISPR-associated protein [Clostridiaceae bacterium]